MLQQPAGRRHDVVQVDDRRLEDLVAAEREQLARQVGRLRRPACMMRAAVSRVESLAFGSASEQLGVSVDRRQHVVEVVRDAAGEAAERLEPLRLEELVAQPVALRLRRAFAR